MGNYDAGINRLSSVENNQYANKNENVGNKQDEDISIFDQDKAEKKDFGDVKDSGADFLKELKDVGKAGSDFVASMFGFAQGKADDFIEDVQITAAGIGGTVEYVSDEIGDAIQDKAESVVETATDISKTVGGVVIGAAGAVAGTVGSVAETVNDVADDIGDAIQDKAESVVETATDIGETVAGTVGDITDNVSENIQVATAAVGGFFNHVGSFFGEAVDAGKVAAEEKRKELDA